MASTVYSSSPSDSGASLWIGRVATGARYVLGLMFIVFGLNGFLHFIPMEEPPVAAGALIGAFIGSGYLWPLIKGTEVVGGALLFTRRTAPLGLLLLAPVVVNIFLFNAFLTPSGIGIALVLLALTLIAAWGLRDRFAPLFRAS